MKIENISPAAGSMVPDNILVPQLYAGDMKLVKTPDVGMEISCKSPTPIYMGSLTTPEPIITLSGPQYYDDYYKSQPSMQH